jgi:superfamily II DNA or RNA helicase
MNRNPLDENPRFTDLETDKEEDLEEERRESEPQDMEFRIPKELVPELQIYNGASIDPSDLTEFFRNAGKDDLYIFPKGDKLLLLVPRCAGAIEQRAILKWNEIDTFRNFTPREICVITILDHNSSLYNAVSLRFPQRSFFLYEIPFYFIPIVKETYKPELFGEMKGEWALHIHRSLKIAQNPLPFEMNKPKFQLRNYQQNAIDCWHENQEFGTIAMATAGGKTIVGIRAICDMKLTTLIAVPTQTLVLQWQKDIIDFLGLSRKEVGIFYGMKKELKPILIGTYSSLMKYITFTEKEENELIKRNDISENYKDQYIQYRRRISDYLQRYYSLLICDESHHIPAPTFRQIALNSKAIYRMSLSATVERFDQNESLLYFACGQKIFKLDFIQLCEQGWVVPFVYNHVPVRMSEEELQVYICLGSNLEAKRQLCFSLPAKIYYLMTILRSHVQIHHQQILIFTSYVRFAYRIFEELLDNGYRADLILSSESQRKKSTRTREKVIELFKAKELDIIISTTVLDEGFNVPDCSVGIIMSGTSSQRQMIQRIGRIVRPSTEQKLGYVYEIVAEGNADLITLDEINHLQRNGKIESIDEYRKEFRDSQMKAYLPEEYWIFNYPQILKYAEQKATKFNVKIIHPFVYK